MPNSRRISIYLNPEKYKILKSILAYKDRNVSEWVREQIDNFLRDHAEKKSLQSNESSPGVNNQK